MASSSYGTAQVRSFEGSIEDRIRFIGEQVMKSQRDPYIRAVALEIVQGLPQHGIESEEAEVSQVFWWVKNNIEYRQDPRDFDYYATAKRTLQFRAGDCDDHVVLMCALLHNLGFKVGARVISPDGYGWHIYALVGFPRTSPSGVLALDTTQAEAYPGWEPGVVHRSHEVLVTFNGDGTIIKRIR